ASSESPAAHDTICKKTGSSGCGGIACGRRSNPKQVAKRGVLSKGSLSLFNVKAQPRRPSVRE
ncbi:MAG: hypothetical protein OEW32_09800, partial [Nitrospira sp.]|nr:hypothetical protein [Nitrospira sp.]